MNRSQLVAAFFLVFFVFIVFQVLRILSPFAQPIFWAAILAFAFYPLHTRLKRRSGKHENTPALLTTGIVFLAFVPLVLFLVLSLAGESVKFYQWAIDVVREQKYLVWWEELRHMPLVSKAQSLLHRFGFDHLDYQAWLGGAAKSAAAAAGTPAAAVTRAIVLFPLNFLLTFFLVFFFLRDGSKVYRFVYDATPMEEPARRDVFERVSGTFEAVIRGQLVTAIAQAALAGVIFWALGVPLPVFFACATFLVALIPVVGAPIVWFPLVLYLAFRGFYVKAVILCFLGVFGISLVDNILKPLLIGEKTKLPYVLLFLSILGGVQVYGLMGMFVAPAVLSLFFVLLKIYREKYL